MILRTARLPVVPLPVGKPIHITEISEKTLVKASGDVLHADVGRNVVVLPRFGAVCFILSPLASRLFKSIVVRKSLGEAAKALSRRCVPAPRWNEVRRWVAKMSRYGLIELDPESAVGSRRISFEELRSSVTDFHLAA